MHDPGKVLRALLLLDSDIAVDNGRPWLLPRVLERSKIWLVCGECNVEEAIVCSAGDKASWRNGSSNDSSTSDVCTAFCGISAISAGKPGAVEFTGDGGRVMSVCSLLLAESLVEDDMALSANLLDFSELVESASSSLMMPPM